MTDLVIQHYAKRARERIEGGRLFGIPIDVESAQHLLALIETLQIRIDGLEDSLSAKRMGMPRSQK